MMPQLPRSQAVTPQESLSPGEDRRAIIEDLLRLVRHICQTPVALLHLHDREWFQFPTVTDELGELAQRLVENTPIDRLSASNLAGGNILQFIVRLPLLDDRHQPLGEIVACDRIPHAWEPEQAELLQTLARQASRQLHPPQLLARAAQVNPHPIVACNASGEAIALNQAAQTLSQQLNIEIAQLFPRFHIQLVQACLASQQYRERIEVSFNQRTFRWLYQPCNRTEIVYLYGHEITDYKQSEAKLLHEALHDELTGLPNRTLFMERLKQAVEQNQRYARTAHKSYPFALLFLDLDRFKLINDSLGHLVGDQLLQMIARRLESAILPRNIGINGANDTVARLGGDEFAILLDRLHDRNEAIAIAERLHELFRSPFHLYGSPLAESETPSRTFHEVFTTVSIGITFPSPRTSQPETLLRDADIALYRAKAQGRGRHEVFDATMHASTIALLQLENDLRRAVQRQEFQVYYQPIIALDTGRIAGFEALVRWHHPERGFVSPSEFITTSEETGLIIPLGAWVLRQACLQLQQWQTEFATYPPLTMSVNISSTQLSHPDFSEQVSQILQEVALEPGSLKLEITESVLMENADAAASLLEQLRAQTIHLCIDDFGTGYSSLSYLQRFPINMLKVDKSFVTNLGVDEESSEIVRAIISLGNNLGMYVTAEGVETEEQLVQLWALHCDYGQGYLFSKPLKSEDARALLEASPQW
ncbi:sensor domain-containing phosphodiesterase [Oscillatoria laete-virens NRMC-F 0139]|nr:sensor domain-containing phosphodiesterase [Oscillatoria laete-virens]MDL5053733.1 sensor domain-containing phosphodiesterase [Oscillatoria laete-virens NRMC-F 0139]